MGSHRREDAVVEESDSTTAGLHIDDLNQSTYRPTWGTLIKRSLAAARSGADPKVWALGVADRVLRTLVQATVGYITAIQLITPGTFNLIQFAGIAGGAAVVSIGTSLIAAPTFYNSWWYQILERGVKTFAQVFISAMVTTTVAGVTFTTIPTGMKAILASAGIAALTSVATSIASTSIGDSDSVDLITDPPVEK